MNDLEHDLRTLLQEKANGAGVPEPSPPLLRRARRRQLGQVVGGVVLVAVIAAGAVAGISALAPADRNTPGDTIAPLVDTTVNGLTVTHPEDWYVVDPAAAGIELGSRDLPRMVLFVSETDPMASGTLGCPGLGDGAAEGFVMTLQEEPLALVGAGARPWPVELETMDVGTSESACYPSWTFRRAAWTAGGRTFEARVGVGPDVSDEVRAAIDAAYASLTVAATETGPNSAVIATGTAGGEDWELMASRQSDGLGLTLQWPTGGTGTGGFEDVPGQLQVTSHVFGQGDDREVVVFGAVRRPGASVEAFPVLGGPAVSAAVLDVPDEISGDLDAFVLVYRPDLPELGADLNLYDESGRTLATIEVLPGGPAEGNETAPRALTDGRIDGHRWWLIDVGRELQLVEDIRGDFTGDFTSGAELTVLMTASRTPSPEMSFGAYTFDDGSGSTAMLVFGTVAEDASSVIFSSDQGPRAAELVDLGDGLRAYWFVLAPGGIDGQVAAVDADCGVLAAIQLSTWEEPSAIAEPVCTQPGD